MWGKGMGFAEGGDEEKSLEIYFTKLSLFEKVKHNFLF